MRLPVLIALAGALVLAAAAPSLAYWQAGGAGTGQGPVATLGSGSRPAVTATGQTVTVTWTQTSFQGRPIGTFAGGGYRVLRRPAAGATAVTPTAGCDTVVSGAAATLSCAEDGVPAGSWSYTVTPVLGSWTGAQGAASAAVTVAPPAPVLSAPDATNPSTAQATGDIRLAWAAAAGATGYNVYRRAAGGTYDYRAALNGSTPITGTAYIDPGTGLAGGTTYAYVVRAVAGAVDSADSNERTATAVARPAAPASVTAAPRAGARIDVGWAAVTGATGYNVYRRTATGSFDYTAPLNGTTAVGGTSYTDATATDGTTYRYVVRAIGPGAGASTLESADSAQSAAATADGTAPSSVALTDPGSPLRGSVTLSAAASDAGSGLASVRVQYVPAGGSAWLDACTATAAPYGCTFATTALADGLYDVRAIATDLAGNATTSAVVASRRVDNTAPTAGVGDPGAFLRATVTLVATGSDGGSGLATLRIQRAATGTTAWTDVCTMSSSPASCALNTTTLADGGYDLRAVATDAAGNSTTSALVANRVIDNTAPTGADVQTTNKPGGTAGKPEAGDVITYTFSEPILPASILAGWSGAATPVTVRFTNGNPDVVTLWNGANTAQLPLGSVTSGKKYVTTTTTFTSSSLVLSGNTIAVTLGTTTGTTVPATGTTTLQWTTSPPAGATDRAGNPLAAATVAELGTLDLDY